MTAALTLMVIFVLSFTLVRLAAVAMRLTGLPAGQAKFQALSALTGTGFTTTEAELIVNYPIRRKIVSNLMIIGNLGLLSVGATVMISFLRTDANAGSVLVQAAWIIGGVGLLWLVMANEHVDKYLCGFIAFVLRRYTQLGQRRYERLLQVGDGVSVAEHRLAKDDVQCVEDMLRPFPELKPLALRLADGTLTSDILGSTEVRFGDTLILYGFDRDHDRLSHMTSSSAEAEP